MKKFTFIDLFAGGGGLSIGIQNAGFKLVGATDWDHWSCETLKANHPDIFVYEGDIKKISPKKFSQKIGSKDVDLIVGGPPCQGFSQLGKRDSLDPRNQLWSEYMKFVLFFNPKLFLIENVPQLLTSQEYEKIKSNAEKLGYTIISKVVHAVDYGVPQKRKRAIIIGSRIGDDIEFPKPTHADPLKLNLLNFVLKPWRTVENAIADLPRIPTNEDWHIGRNPTEKSLLRYKSIPMGGNRFDLPEDLKPECWKKKKTGSTDVFGRLDWSKPSLTIRTEFFKPEKGCYLHPEAHRPITIREAARLQTFPDSYIFVGSNVQVAKQVGNAVPVMLAEAIGKQLFQFLKTNLERLNNNTVNSFPVFQGNFANIAS